MEKGREELENEEDPVREDELHEEVNSTLQDNYTEEEEEDSYNSGSDIGRDAESIKNEENYLYFLQAVKDGNVDYIGEQVNRNDVNMCKSNIKIRYRKKRCGGYSPIAICSYVRKH
jgi:hypothetical protein